jgi:hypothetical protein
VGERTRKERRRRKEEKSEKWEKGRGKREEGERKRNVRSGRKDEEREKKEKGKETARCFCFWPEDRNVRRRLAVLECGFLLFSVFVLG